MAITRHVARAGPISSQCAETNSTTPQASSMAPRISATSPCQRKPRAGLSAPVHTRGCGPRPPHPGRRPFASVSAAIQSQPWQLAHIRAQSVRTRRAQTPCRDKRRVPHPSLFFWRRVGSGEASASLPRASAPPQVAYIIVCMRFEIVTIFPGFFSSIFENGILRRALAEGLVEVGIHDLRATSPTTAIAPWTTVPSAAAKAWC
jgi:hypothetical protein